MENEYTKIIGNSKYSIQCTNPSNGKIFWYIQETWNDGKRWNYAEAYYRESLEDAVDILNLLTKEKEIISFKQWNRDFTHPPMPVEDAYEYFYTTYESGIYSLQKLQKKHADGERMRSEMEASRGNSLYFARDYETYNNMQRALKYVIRDILRQRMDSVLKPVPKSIETLDLAAEERKITMAHRALHSTIKQGRISGDSFYHNLRAYFINRVEQASDYKLVVDLDGMDALSEAKIRNRKKYLIEKYGTCKSSLCLSCEETNCNRYLGGSKL